MAKTKANEREFQGQVISWIKKQIGHGGLPFKNAINDPGLYGLPTTRFPDVLLTLDFECRSPFCGWELKTPATAARDDKLLKDAVEKAQTIEAKYFVTWNMQTAIIWRTPEKSRATVTEQYKIQERIDHRITDVNDIRDPVKAILLEDMCIRLLLDLHRLYDDEKVNLHIADTTIFVGIVSNASNKMSDSLLKDLHRQRSSKVFETKLRAWATKQGISRYDEEYWQGLSRQIAYRIIGKILFYMSLRRGRIELPRFELPRNNYKQASQQLRSYFQKALEVDYQAIFEPDITDEIELSHQTIDIVIELTENLTHWSFELAPLDVIGKVFEDVIPQEARHTLGQYFTPENLVDLIVSFCVKGENDYVMDPTCGTGTFLIRSYNKLKQFKPKTHHELLNQIWGFDIAGFPAELATINLCRQDFGDYLNFPRVLRKDFFDVNVGDEYEFPPPKKGAKIQERVKVKIPKFDALVGNFPFIRQELIEKVEKGYKKKINTILSDSWLKSYPEFFDGDELCLSGQADIYAYMFFHAAAHLKEGGRMGFITSNSWLDVAYGYEMQKFFLNKFKIIAICESRCEPWFEQSAVNTVFTILERSDDVKANRENLTRFVKFKKPLKELFPEDALTDTQARWIRLERFVDKLDGICANGKAWDKKCKKFATIETEYIKEPAIISYEDEDVRMRIINQGDLRNAVYDEGRTVKWGKYLRAPEIYFEIMEKCADKFVPLEKVADIRFGIKTGINEFFYLTDEQIEHWGIEKEFLKPAIKSPKESLSIKLEEKDLKNKVFLCNKEKAALRGTNALKYIKYGEQKKTGDGKPWPEVESVKGRNLWYDLGERTPGIVLVSMVTGSSLRCILNDCDAQVDHNLFEIMTEDTRLNDGIAIYLNSTVSFLCRELFGRANLGDGALKIEGIDWKRLLVPNEDALKKLGKDCKNTFKKLCGREIKDIKTESKHKDRLDFEKDVLKSLGLDEELTKRILNAVVELVEERHSIPKLRTKQKKKRVEQDLGKLKEEIAEEVLSGGIKKFPDGFIKKSWSQVEYEEMDVPADKLRLGENFFGKQQICLENGDSFMEVGSEERGKFIVYAKKKDEFVVKLPKSETIVKKAVQEYEIYLKEIRDKLLKAFLEQCGDRIVSENLTRQIFDEMELPYLKSE
ncbi:MAG: N-6 DNA methylase [Phycisphaerae bacterium]|nr:N-6 DNA methylase [Phycisphaerae bacterium]